MPRWLLLSLLFGLAIASSFEQPSSSLFGLVNIGSSETQQWFANSTLNVPVDGTVITSILPAYTLENWYNVTVPGTVLTALLENEIIPDPYYGLNNQKIIDISQTNTNNFSYWFATYFKVPFSSPKAHVWLELRGINYYANVFLNGARVNVDTLAGMFMRQRLEITEYYFTNNFINVLAIATSPPDPPGVPNGGQCGDGTIGESVTLQYLVGWDWMQPVHDRSTGIWDKITVRSTGEIILNHPFVETSVPGIRYPDENRQSAAYYKLKVTLENLAQAPLTAHLSWSIMDPNNASDVYDWNSILKLEPMKSTDFESENIQVDNPRLWWVNQYGPQHLYTLRLNVSYEDEDLEMVLSDSHQFSFAFRNLSSNIDLSLGGRVFQINGQQIFVRGSNWIGLDAMMRGLNSTNYENAVRMHRDMGLMMIRVWGGGITERPEFYDACDKYGILVWQEFWITGDCDGAWIDPTKKDSQARRGEYPNWHSLFLASATDAILMLRSHPSLALWCGGNEWKPPADILPKLQALVNYLDPGRLFIPSSLSDGLGPSDGPYGINFPTWFYTFRDPNVFNPEMGSVGMPTADTMREMMPEEDLYPFGENNSVWNYHTFIPYSNDPVPDQIYTYGTPLTIDQYCTRAQIVNYIQYKALIEGRLTHMWEWYTGILIWKSQNPWTGLRGQFYDWFGEQTGAYFGLKHANELVHVQLNLATNRISIVNHSFKPISNATVVAQIYPVEASGSSLQTPYSQKSQLLNIGVSRVHHTDEVLDLYPVPNATISLYFVQLSLYGNYHNEEDHPTLLSQNLYWIYSDVEKNENVTDLYVALNNLDQVLIVANVSGERCFEDGNNGVVRYELSVSIHNLDPTNVAFWIQLSVRLNSTRVLPVFYSDNYFSLLPEEHRLFNLSFSLVENMEAFLPQVWVNGWNISPIGLTLTDFLKKGNCQQ